MDVRKLFPVLVLSGVGVGVGCSGGSSPGNTQGAETTDGAADAHDAAVAADTAAADTTASGDTAAAPGADVVDIPDFGTPHGDGALHW
ncbi:MAG: hypothetical protein ACHREM_26710 [Polyangiales bacterium]